MNARGTRGKRGHRLVARRLLSAGAALIASLLALAGCQWGGVSFQGDLGGRGFDPGGTVLSYLDEHDDDLVVDDRPRVVVFMTWIIFNPAGDLNDLDGATLEDYRHEMRLRDAMSIVFDDQADVTGGASFTSCTVGGTESTDGPCDGTTTDGPVSVRMHFAPERLNALTTYDAYQPFGSVRKVSIDVGAAGFTPPTPTVDGNIRVEVEVGDDDPADALVGTLSGTFSAPLVDERVAEHNLGLLGADEILGVPLAPREGTP